MSKGPNLDILEHHSLVTSDREGNLISREEVSFENNTVKARHFIVNQPVLYSQLELDQQLEPLSFEMRAEEPHFLMMCQRKENELIWFTEDRNRLKTTQYLKLNAPLFLAVNLVFYMPIIIIQKLKLLGKREMSFHYYPHGLARLSSYAEKEYRYKLEIAQNGLTDTVDIQGNEKGQIVRYITQKSGLQVINKNIAGELS